MGNNGYDRDFYGRQETWVRKFLNRRFPLQETRGIERLVELKEKQPDAVIFHVASHKSHIDEMYLKLILHQYRLKPPFLLAAASLFEIPFVGDFIGKMGAIPIDRNKSGRQYLRHIAEKIVKYLSQGDDAGVFPEGSRSYEGHIRKFSRFFFSCPVEVQKKTSRPTYVIPSANSYDIVIEDKSFTRALKHGRKEESLDFFWNMGISHFFPGHAMYLDFGEPIPVEGKTARELMDQSFDQVKKLYRVLPTSLVAEAALTFQGNVIGKSELRDKIQDRLSILDSSKTNLATVENMSLEQITSEGGYLLSKRGALIHAKKCAPFSLGGDNIPYLIKNRPLLQYYARMIEHV